jgi:hypothetical protein
MENPFTTNKEKRRNESIYKEKITIRIKIIKNNIITKTKESNK